MLSNIHKQGRWLTALGLSALLLSSSLTPLIAVPAQAQTASSQLPAVADLAEKLLPSVVEISTQSKADDEGSSLDLPGIPDSAPFKDFFDEFLNKRRGTEKDEGGKPRKRSVNSMGSGFVIDPSGIIITNNHVIEGAETIEVHFQNSKVLKAELVGRDPKTDIAVLRVKSDTPLPAVAFGDSDKARVGEWVMAIGNPFGLGGSVSLGIISARNRDINAGPYDDFIQTDAAINKGNSGGPLFDMAGNVVGINTAIFSPSGGSVGIGFSVPSNTAKTVVAQLVKYGETRRGWLGVKIQSVTDDIAESMGLPAAKGALIADVTKTGPAEKAGIEPGDVIISFNGKPIKEMKDLSKMVADTDVGATVPVIIMRKGKEMTLQVEVGRLEKGEKLVDAKGQDEKPMPSDATITLMGMKLSAITEAARTRYKLGAGIKGVVITSVESDSIAADKMLEAGDVITEAGEKAVSTTEDIEQAVASAKAGGKNSLLLLVAKAGNEEDMRFIALKLKK